MNTSKYKKDLPLGKRLPHDMSLTNPQNPKELKTWWKSFRSLHFAYQILIWIILGIIVISGFFVFVVVPYLNYKKDSAQTPTYQTTVNGDGNATAVGNNSQATVNNTNKLAVYTWQNKEKLETTLNGTNGYKYQTTLIFKADSPVIPQSACLKITSDNNLGNIQWEASGSFNDGPRQSFVENSKYVFQECFTGQLLPEQHITIRTYEIPSIFNAELTLPNER